MRIVYVLFFIIAFSSINGQTNSMDDLLDKLYEQVVPNEFEYYNLKEISFVMKSATEPLQNFQKRELLKRNSDFPLSLILNPKIDTTLVNWKSYNLPNAIIKSELECEKLVKDFNNKSSRAENEVFYSFSTPIFSTDEKYCAISVTSSYRLRSETTNYFFKFENGNWKYITDQFVTATKSVIHH